MQTIKSSAVLDKNDVPPLTVTAWVTVCSFRREQDGPVEEGIAFGYEPGVSDIKCIIDTKGNFVDVPIWNYNLWPYRGSFTAELLKLPAPFQPEAQVEKK